MLERQNPMMAAMATYTAVQVAWLETAFRPMERLSMPAPVMKIQSAKYQYDEPLGTDVTTAGG